MYQYLERKRESERERKERERRKERKKGEKKRKPEQTAVCTMNKSMNNSYVHSKLWLIKQN